MSLKRFFFRFLCKMSFGILFGSLASQRMKFGYSGSKPGRKKLIGRKERSDVCINDTPVVNKDLPDLFQQRFLRRAIPFLRPHKIPKMRLILLKKMIEK